MSLKFVCLKAGFPIVPNIVYGYKYLPLRVSTCAYQQSHVYLPDRKRRGPNKTGVLMGQISRVQVEQSSP